MTSATRHQLFNAFKITVYALLTFNIYLYLVHETLHEALDSLGWVLLLGVFEWETRALGKPYVSRWEQAAIWALQLVGYGLALNSWWTYWHLGEWMDFANATVWLIVCATIVYDVFVPGRFGTLEWRLRNGFKIALYIVLAGFAVYWGVTGDLLDFYDATLWIVCFLVIEVNIFSHEQDDAAEGKAPA